MTLAEKILAVHADRKKVSQGDFVNVRVDLAKGRIKNLNSGMVFTAKPYPDFMTELISAGGLIEHTKKRMRV